MSNGHAPRPPSGAAAWVKCGAWVAMNGAFPGADSEASAEGVAAHEILESVYYVGSSPDTTANGTPVDDEMMHGARMFAEHVRRHVCSPDLDVTFEQRLPPGRFGPDVWGTPDLFFWNSPHELHVMDYKYGHGFVDAFENWQLLTYAALILDWFQIDGLQEQSLTIHLHIVQPRNFEGDGPIRTWSAKAADLRAYWNKIENAVGLSTTTAVTGPHCKHCPGRLGCAANRRASGYVEDVVLEAEPLNLPMDIAGPELRRLRRARDLLDARIKGLEDEITIAIERGQHEHGFALERKRGRRKWSGDAEQVLSVGQAFGVDLAKPVQVVSPRQAELAGLPPQIVNALSTSEAGTLELIPVEQSKARKIFGHNKTEQ